MSVYTPPHWSATRFMCFDVCPGEYRARYVDERPLEQTEALCFGKAVHMGLEAHYQGADGDLAFRRAWRQLAQEVYGRDRAPETVRLMETGLHLFDSVRALGLEGIPEFGFSLDLAEERLGAPIVGAIDLFGDGVVYDFKTTLGTWSEERVEREVWQPMLYTWAYAAEYAELPAFEYIVCSRATGRVQRFRREWTEDSWWEQAYAMLERAGAIADAVSAGNFECHGKHGLCPECGDRWGHEHTCDSASMSPRARVGGIDAAA